MLKRLLIWIMVFALPLQGFAAAAMIHCAPSHHAAQSAAVAQHEGHDHAGGHEHHAAANADDHQLDTAASADICSACHSCCMSTISLVSFTADFFLPAGVQVLAPNPVGTLSSVILEGPQRPPRPSFA